MTIPQNIQAGIFDLDGLLIDSERFWDQADSVLLQKRGFMPTEELFLKRLGTGHMPTMQIYKDEFGIEETVESLGADRLIIFYDILWKDLQMMEGARELIEQLRKKNIALAIATGGHTQENLATILRKLNISSHFSSLVTSAEVGRQKPFPDIFLKAAKGLEIDPKDCLVFEDAPSGVKAAKAAGMMAIGVNKKPAAQKELQEAGADEVLTSLTEVTV
ncbi:MAG TPA: HAD family phosphatase [Patescibacteria group bacterium]|nr:HAD family phosphatase [Patescibacteria group bacterium]